MMCQSSIRDISRILSPENNWSIYKQASFPDVMNSLCRFAFMAQSPRACFPVQFQTGVEDGIDISLTYARVWLHLNVAAASSMAA